MKQRSVFKTEEEFQAYVSGRIEALEEQLDAREAERNERINLIKWRLKAYK